MAAPTLTVDVGTGLVAGARFLRSPNADQRPPGAGVEMLIVHGISLPPGRFTGEYVEDFFLNRLAIDEHPFFREIETLKVSAHLYLRRDGRIIQFVPLHQRAWHAGVSQFRHRLACNDFSVGVELEGSDDIPYERAQYEQLAALIHALAHAYPAFDPEAVVGHSDVAPGRKSDPGPAFDWARLRVLAAGAPA
jgi:N-acetyl-anhydromuramoyl-L-alanine amidase